MTNINEAAGIREKNIQKALNTLEKMKQALEEDLYLKGDLARLIFNCFKENMSRRLNMGYDIHGQSFKPYSKRYAKRKGRSSPVDLKLSGKMRDSITYRVEGNFVIIYPKHESYEGKKISTAQLWAVHQRGLRITKRGSKGYFRMPRREGFGLSSVGKEDLLNRVKNFIIDWARNNLFGG